MPSSAHATGDVTAGFVVSYSKGQDGIYRVVFACKAEATETEAALVRLGCDLFDSSSSPSIHHQRSFSGPRGYCVINAFNVVAPFEFCATATATFRDLSTKTSSTCVTGGGTSSPPHNPPAAHTPGILECLDPAATGI